ncbi:MULTISPECIES: aminotransferase class IV [Flavobacterium]|jgi:branched-chain amino acid aminotransferase|uniref:branched-chain-amino-acid transaminase n=1 Tax=Flavobacterium macrobrachii TaxID=591204 RepID=A0ABS2CV88_9FLAO|nr:MULTISPECIES: aminotransferase class IV [Flavobacterium]MBM6498890.1 aminotransferase class IV [Flavobacterium macrobrachii]MCZ8091778.1 aminotransferase class IV [Flavobacterium sp.]PZO30573.1 MAG: aminotransferase class IV [Flavobacteriaceae bacterium]
MINFNGLLQDNFLITSLNRSFLYGDGIFETLKIVDGKILFSEDHYFRLMASMRIVRMKIPMDFTLEFFENQVISLTNALNCSHSARVRITIFRNDGGLYLPNQNSISYIIEATSLASKKYEITQDYFEVDLFKDSFVSAQLLSTLKTTSKILNVTASIFAKENDLNTCLLLNDKKNVVEAIAGNLFMLTGNKLITPPISEGCLNGIMRKQIIRIMRDFPEIEFSEETISPFDLQKADELFITNVIQGIQPITRYRKKEFKTTFSVQLLDKINKLI